MSINKAKKIEKQGKMAILLHFCFALVFVWIYVWCIFKIYSPGFLGVSLTVLWIFFFPIIGSNIFKKIKIYHTIQIFKKLLGNDPDNIAYLASLGALHAKLNKWEAAIPYFGKWVELQPNKKEPYYGLIQALVAKRDYDTAKEYCRKHLQRYPDDAVVYASLGSVYCDLKEMDLAKESLEKAQKLFEKNGDLKKAKSMKRLLMFMGHFAK